jgi:hypothetical protein
MYRVVAVAALGLAALAAAPALKHTRLKRSEPMADSTVAVPPRAIRLWFSEPVQISVTTVRLTEGIAGSTARVIETTPPHMDSGADAPVIAEIRGPMALGRFNVAWHTMSRDGHAVSGTFKFSVAEPPLPRQ